MILMTDNMTIKDAAHNIIHVADILLRFSKTCKELKSQSSDPKKAEEYKYALRTIENFVEIGMPQSLPEYTKNMTLAIKKVNELSAEIRSLAKIYETAATPKELEDLHILCKELMKVTGNLVWWRKS
jgi:hypothetical protein